MSPYASRTKVAYTKMDDMTKLIKNMFVKISRLEMENKNQNEHV